MALKNYTTTIASVKTVGEIQTLLAKSGARSVHIEFDDKGNAAAIAFTLLLDGHLMAFRLPRNTEGALKSLRAAKIESRYKNIDHAARVSWRILKDWVDAQLALVQCNQAEMAQAFMPYAMMRDKPMFETFREERSLRLGNGNTID